MFEIFSNTATHTDPHTPGHTEKVSSGVGLPRLKIHNFVIYISKPSDVLVMTGPVVTWFYRTCQVLSLNLRPN